MLFASSLVPQNKRGPSRPGLPGKMGTRGSIRDCGSTAAQCSTTCGYHTIKDLQKHEQGYDELTCRRVVKHNHRPQRAKSSTMIPSHRYCPLAPCICISFIPRTMRIHHHAIHCCSLRSIRYILNIKIGIASRMQALVIPQTRSWPRRLLIVCYLGALREGFINSPVHVICNGLPNSSSMAFQTPHRWLGLATIWKGSPVLDELVTICCAR